LHVDCRGIVASFFLCILQNRYGSIIATIPTCFVAVFSMQS
jgi:hypothetical protein